MAPAKLVSVRITRLSAAYHRANSQDRWTRTNCVAWMIAGSWDHGRAQGSLPALPATCASPHTFHRQFFDCQAGDHQSLDLPSTQFGPAQGYLPYRHLSDG
jgi:hypothetical protein